MSNFEVSLNELITQILQKKPTSTNTGKILPTIIGNLEESTDDGLCVCVPTVGENSSANEKLFPGILPCMVIQNGFFIKFAYIQNGEPFLLFYDTNSNKFIGFKINAILLKIPKHLNDLIIIKLEEFCKTLDTSVKNL